VRLEPGPILDRAHRQRVYTPVEDLAPDRRWQLVFEADHGHARQVERVEVRTAAPDHEPPLGRLDGPALHFADDPLTVGRGNCTRDAHVLVLAPPSRPLGDDGPIDGSGSATRLAVRFSDDAGRLTWDTPPDAILLGGPYGLEIGDSSTCGSLLIRSVPERDGLRIGLQAIDLAGNRGAPFVVETEPWGWIDEARSLPAAAGLDDVRRWLAAGRSADEVADAVHRELTWAWRNDTSWALRVGGSLPTVAPWPADTGQRPTTLIALRWLVALARERQDLGGRRLSWLVDRLTVAIALRRGVPWAITAIDALPDDPTDAWLAGILELARLEHPRR
jgi:hypothetical protein